MKSKLRIELFPYRSKGMKWSWRLRHRNGNVIANAAESYEDKTAARKAAIKMYEHMGKQFPVVEVGAGGETVQLVRGCC